MKPSSVTSAAAVSSHDVSIPRITRATAGSDPFFLAPLRGACSLAPLRFAAREPRATRRSAAPAMSVAAAKAQAGPGPESGLAPQSAAPGCLTPLSKTPTLEQRGQTPFALAPLRGA